MLETHGKWVETIGNIPGEVMSLQVESFSFIFFPGLNSSGKPAPPKTNIAIEHGP